MGRILIVVAMLVALLSPLNAMAATFNDLLNAIHKVESSGKKVGVPDGDGGKAIGPFQIWREYWQDAVEFDKSIGGRYEDCRKYDYAVKVVRAYMRRYAAEFIRKGDWESVARIHNGGPSGHRKSATDKYWRKVTKHLD